MTRLLCQAVVSELVSTGRASFDFRFWHSFDKTDWSRALDWLDVSGLALYFWHEVKTVYAAEALPLHVQTRLAKSNQENCLRVESIKKESEALNCLFDDAGIQYALLKGLALVPDYCPDPTLRTQYDHDYLIHPDTLARAESVLHKAGYRPKASWDGYHISYFRPAPQPSVPRKPTGLYSARLQRPIELHVRLWDDAEEKIAIQLPEDFLDRAGRKSWEGYEFAALSDEDRLIFQVLHAFRHILRNWCRLSTFLEISHFLRQRPPDSDFWNSFQERAGSLRWVPEATTVVLSLAHKLFGGSFPPKVKAQIHPKFSTIVDLWIEFYGYRGALANFQINKNSLFLHREFVDDPAAWAEVWRQRLFPLRRPHRLPNALVNHGPGSLKGRWTQYLHGLQRFKFHALSAAAHAWEYPRWQLLRRVRTKALPQAVRGVQVKADSHNRASKLPAKPLVRQFSKTSAFKE